MGYSDRDYMKPGGFQGRPSMPSFFDGAPVVKKLIIINAAIYLLGVLLNSGGGDPLKPLGAYTITDAWQVWRVITFQFLHADVMHLLANTIGLFFFGPHIERWMGSRPFLLFYLLCGIAGALFYTLLFFSPGLLSGLYAGTPMVGASAGIFGILAAFMVIAPDARVLLFFIIPMKMRTLGIVYFCYETAGVLFNWHNAGGSAGHLGGAILGWFLVKTPALRLWLVKVTEKRSKTRSSKKKSRSAKIIRESPIDVTQEVDRILDKISESGIQSLTKEERNILDKARRQ